MLINIFLMPARGDSMLPTLKNQSIIIVNRTDQLIEDGVYVFRYDGQLRVKRLQLSKSG
jgi:phage repressor protein C with HTH and peptisase S24 domain